MIRRTTKPSLWASTAIISLAFAGGLLSANTARAQMTAPPTGTEYSFNCNSSIRSNYTETYRIVSVQGDNLRVEVDDGTAANWYEKPMHLLTTTLYQKQSLFGKESEMDDLPSDFTSLTALQAGTKVKGWVNEVRRNPTERLPWNYTVSVLGQEALYVPEIGDLSVISVAESRWVDVFSSNLLTYYSPELRFPVYWSYRDSNVAEVECTLASVRGVSVDGIAQGTPLVTPASLVLTARETTGVRRHPSAQAPLIAMMPAAETVNVTGQVVRTGDTWYQVDLGNGMSGFLPADALSEAPASAAQRDVSASASADSTTQTATAPATTTVAPAAPAAAPAAAAGGDQTTRLAKLQQLYDSGLISQEEYQVKREEILGSADDGGIAGQLQDANRRFRAGELTPDNFVQTRSKILAKINPSDMDPKEGLELIQELLAAKLISPTEYTRKRGEMLAAL